MEEIKDTSIQEVKHGKEIIIDYLTVTFEFRSFSEATELEVVDDYVENVRTLLGIPEEQVLEKGFGKGNYRYAYQLADGGMLKLCGPLNERGIHTCSLELKGTGCREFERNRPDFTWYDLLLTLFGMYEARSSRLDLTIDDFEGKDCPFVWIKDKLDREMYTSAFKKCYSIHGNKYDGYSITFGNRKGDTKIMQQLVIYEKDKEQKSKGKKCDQDYWTRFEMRFMHEKAALVMEDIIYAYEGKMRYPEVREIPKGEEGFKTLVSSLLYNLLDIKVDSEYDQKNIYKAPTDPKWSSFVGDVLKAAIPSPKGKEIKWNKFESYVHQTLGKYLLVRYKLSGDNKYQFNKDILKLLYILLDDIIEDKRKRNQLNVYLSENDIEALTVKDLVMIKDSLKSDLEMEDLPF